MLTFIQGSTVTPAEFKSMHSVESLTFCQKEGRDGIYFKADGIVKGACSKKGIPNDPVISLVKGDDGKSFYLVHEKPVIREEKVLGSF